MITNGDRPSVALTVIFHSPCPSLAATLLYFPPHLLSIYFILNITMARLNIQPAEIFKLISMYSNLIIINQVRLHHMHQSAMTLIPNVFVTFMAATMLCPAIAKSWSIPIITYR